MSASKEQSEPNKSEAALMQDNATSPSKHAWQGGEVGDHRIFVFLPFTFQTDQIAANKLADPLPQDKSKLNKNAKCLSKAYGIGASMLLDNIGRFGAEDWLPKTPGCLKQKEKETTEQFEAKVATWNKKPLWCFDDKEHLSNDFHPYIGQIFGYPPEKPEPTSSTGGEPESDIEHLVGLANLNEGKFRSLPTLILSHHACEMLQGELGRTGRGMIVTLGKESGKRAGLGDMPPHELLVKIAGVRVQLFGSGHGLLAFELQFGVSSTNMKLTPGMVLEATYLLSRNPTIRAQINMRWADNGAASKCPSLLDIAETLLPVDYLKPDYKTQSRFFTYSYVQIQTECPLPDEDLKDYALRLGCRFTENYAVQTPEGVASSYSPFHGITHVMTTEGGCTVLAGHREVSFLKNFGQDPLTRVYLPLALLAYHELLLLLSLSHEALVYDLHRTPSDQDAIQLKTLRAKLVQFHLQFRFSTPSVVSLHVRTHASWREALQLDRMLNDAALDVSEAEKILSERLARIRERKINRLTAIGTGCVAAFFIWQVATAYIAHVYDDLPVLALQATIEETQPARRKQIEQTLRNDLEDKNKQEIVWFAVSLILGVGVGCVNWHSLEGKHK